MTPDQLRDWMTRNSYTITELAAETGVARSTLYRYLDGKDRIPDVFKWALKGIESSTPHTKRVTPPDNGEEAV